MYHVNEVFRSVQGEGARAGTANVFVRLARCNLACRADGPAGFDCDTEFSSGRDHSVEELVAAVEAADASWQGIKVPPCRAVILTGGEPALQVDGELCEALKGRGYYVAIETNGTKSLPKDMINWIACSPKTAEHALRVGQVDELRYVRHEGQGIPVPMLAAAHRFVSPAAGPDGVIPRGNLEWCLRLVHENPGWRLSVQQHKGWRVR